MCSRLSDTEQNSPLVSSARHEQPSVMASKGLPASGRQPAAPFLPASEINRSPRANNFEGGQTGEQQGAGDRASLNTHKLPLSAAPLTPQEDLCSFHSPRSFPGDSVDDRASPGRGPEEESRGTQAGVLQQMQEKRAEESQKDCSVASAGPPHQHEATGGEEVGTHNEQSMDEERQLDAGLQELQRQQAQQESELNSGVSSMGASAMSECEGEWIRVEESCRDKPSAPAVPVVDPASAQPADTEPLSEHCDLSPVEALPPESSPSFPICIGSAVQAGEPSGPNRSALGPVEGVSPGKPSAADCKYHPPASPHPSSTEPSDVTSPNGLMSSLSAYVAFFGRSVAGCRIREQQLHQEALASVTGEAAALPIHKKAADWERSRLLQDAADWHRSFLDLYGGPCEEVMRLALQVLPAQAADYQSERRLLFIQGLFDVFCLYRSHFLSPTEGLLHAEALHQRGRLRVERSLGSAGVAPPSAGFLTDFGLFDVEKISEAKSDGGEGLPLSVRLALYGAVSLALKIVRTLQLLLEVNKLRQGGEGQRFALCMRLELLKLVLKMILYSLTPFAFYCDEQSISQAVEIHKGKQIAAEAEKLTPCYGRRTGRRIHPLPSALSQAQEYQAPPVPRAPELPRKWALLVVLWVVKELKKTLSWHRISDIGNRLASCPWRSLKSWTPWLVALLVEAQSVSLLHGSPQVMGRLSPIEAAELRRRVTGLPYALLRPPFFDKFLARPCEAVDYVVRRVPLLNHFKYV
ncbi:hypothetical protein Esti_004825 [Eimeria stiedai]